MGRGGITVHNDVIFFAHNDPSLYYKTVVSKGPYEGVCGASNERGSTRSVQQILLFLLAGVYISHVCGSLSLGQRRYPSRSVPAGSLLCDAAVKGKTNYLEAFRALMDSMSMG